MPRSSLIAELVWCAGVVAWFILRLPHQLRAWRQPVRVNRSDRLDWCVVAFFIMCNAVLPFAYVVAKVPRFANYPFVPAFAWTGSAVFLAALWLFHRTHRDLGRNFSMSLEIRREHRLVTGGAYARIRHPIYLGFFLWGIAQTLLLPNWVAGPAGLAGAMALFLFRVSREERLMLEEFGQQYSDYMRRTARLVPWIY